MRFANYLNRVGRYLRRGSRKPRSQKLQSRLSIEQLEDRMVPSTLFVDLAGNAHYSVLPPLADTVTLSERPVIFSPAPSAASPPISIPFERVITDAAQTINVTGPGAFHWGGSGTNQVFTLEINLALAGGIATSVFNINDVLGGSGNNILVGNGNNFLRGGSGRDILISGGGSSTLQAASGEAILIGAHYIFDTNLAQLTALEAVWSSPLPYVVRVHDLIVSGALSPLTVKPQPGVTTVISGVGLDFLIFDPGDILAKPVRTGLGEVALFV